MTDVPSRSTDLLDEAHQLGQKIAAIDFIERYRILESKVEEHAKIQALLEQLRTSAGSDYTVTREALLEIPLFAEYIELQQQVEGYLKDVIYIFVSAVSPKIVLQEKSHSGGCHQCHEC